MTTAYYQYPIERFLIKIVNNNHFVMSRFNDGEWYCMRREHRNNLESHPCYEQLSKDMLTAIINPANYKAWLEDKYLFQASFFWKRWREDYVRWNLKIKFIQNDIIHVLSREEPPLWIKLIEILNTKNIIIVGPPHIKKFSKLKYEHFIEIPYRKCYLSKIYVIYSLCKHLNILDEYLNIKKNKHTPNYEKPITVIETNKSVNIYNQQKTSGNTLDDILTNIIKSNSNIDSIDDDVVANSESGNMSVSDTSDSNKKEYVVLMCGGMLSNCVIDDLFPFVKDKHTILDFGSVFDIFINDPRIVRRAVVKNEKLNKIRKLYPQDWIF